MRHFYFYLFSILLILSTVAQGATEIDSFLQAQKRIRIYVDAAPGFGHQSAGLSVMTRLRELGFHGEFEVVYQASVQDKIEKIYPNFPEGVPQEVRYLNLENYKKLLESEKIAPVEFAVSGADDGFGSEFAKYAKAKNYLRLQPLGWGQSTLYNDDARALLGLQNLPLTNLASPEVKQILESLNQQQDLTPAKRDFIFKFSELSSRHFSFPIYGVGVQAFAAQRMYFYAKAAKSAAQKLSPTKAVIVPVISPFNSQEMDTLFKVFGKTPGFEGASPAEKKHQKQMHVLTPEQFTALDTLSPGHIYFVFVESIPQKIFNFFYEKASFPVWVAGKNALSFALSQGKAYLSTVDDYHLPGLNDLSVPEKKLIHRAQNAFNTGYQEYSNQSRLNDLSKFIQESATAGSGLQKFYSGIGASVSSNDKVLEGLRHVLGTPTILMCSEVF